MTGLIRERARPWLWLVLAILAVAAVYWPGMRGGFAFDDYPNLVLNANLHVTSLQWADWVAAVFSSQSSELQRPLAMLSFALNHYFTGLDPMPMKVTNLAIHLANTVALFLLLRTVLAAATLDKILPLREHVALFAALAWALLPINLLVVLLVVQRMEGLAQLFVLLGLWAYVTGRSRMIAGRPGLRIAVLGLALGSGLGALAKESAVLLPVYALMAEIVLFRFQSSGRKRDSRVIGTFVLLLAIPMVIGLVWLVPRALAPGAFASRDFTLIERLLTEPRVLVDYLRWTVLPDLSQLSLFHDDYPVSRSLWRPPASAVALLLCAALLGTGWWARTRRPLTSLGISWFFAAHLLTATIVPLELVFEHRNYFASIGVILVLSDLLLLSPTSAARRRLGLIVGACLLLFYTSVTSLRAVEWSNPLRFAQTEAAKHPTSPRATYQLAQTLAILSEGKAASPFTRAAFDAYERARILPNASISADQGALLLAERTGTPIKTAWWRDMQSRLRSGPVGPQELGSLGSLVNCALVRVCRFPPDEMLNTFAAALSHGDNPEVLNIYGNYALNILHDVPLTERCWTRAAELKPTEPQYVVSLAKLMMAVGRDDESRRYIRKLRSLGRFGQYGRMADALETRLANEIKGRRPEAGIHP